MWARLMCVMFSTGEDTKLAEMGDLNPPSIQYLHIIYKISMYVPSSLSGPVYDRPDYTLDRGPDYLHYLHTIYAL